MDDLENFQALYEAFNRRDIDSVLAMMSEEVDWPNAWKDGRLTGREAVRDYWTTQWAKIDPYVEPLSASERADGLRHLWPAAPGSATGALGGDWRLGERTL